MKLEALFALYPPLRINSNFYLAEFERFIDHFKTRQKVHIRGSGFHDGELLSAQVEQCRPSRHRRFFRHTPLSKPGGWLLRFEGSFTFPGEERCYLTEHTGKRLIHSTEELASIWKSFLPNDLDVTIQTYICALMIAFSGAVRPTGNAWLLDSKRTDFTSTYVSTIDDAVEYLVENGVKPRGSMEPDKVIKWVFSQNGIFDGYSDTPAARALNYFTRLFNHEFRNDELGDLVWALAGIEAFLVEGGRSSVGQLKEKIIAILAPDIDPTWLLKMTDQMYRYRSRMVHGDRQIRSAFRTDDATEIDSRFREEYDSDRFAAGILLVLLQRAIEHNVTKFQFKTVSVN
jgi:hypothetical protein